MLLDHGQIRLRQGEQQRNRLDLGDDDETVGVGRMNDVADVDLADAGDAGNGRGQARIAELDVGLVDLRLVGLHGGLELRHLRRLRLDQLRGRIALVAELGVAGEIGFGIGELRLVAVAIGRQTARSGPRRDADRSGRAGRRP